MVYARHVDLSDEAVKHDHMVREIYPPFYAMFDPVRKFPLCFQVENGKTNFSLVHDLEKLVLDQQKLCFQLSRNSWKKLGNQNGCLVV